MKTPDLIDGQIPDWEKNKYIPRNDLKNPPWFRLNYELAMGEKIQAVPIEHRWVWMCLLSAATKQNERGKVQLGFGYFCRAFHLPEATVAEALISLSEAGLLNLFDARTDAERETNGSRADGDREPTAPRPEPSVSRPRRVVYVTERNVTEEEECPPSAPDGAPPNPLFEIWNEACGSLPKALSLSEKRRRRARELWKQRPEPDYWRSVVKRLAGSPFCCGKNDRGWRADFDFFLQSETHIRAMEGKYDPVGDGGPGKPIPGQFKSTPVWAQEEDADDLPLALRNKGGGPGEPF